MKECCRCKEAKPESDFGKASHSIDGLQPVCKACHKQYYRESDHERRRENAARRYWERRLLVVARLGGKCVECGYQDFRALQIDHVNGGGTIENRTTDASCYLRKLLMLSDEDLHQSYQLLCANCNWVKRWERNEANCHRRDNILDTVTAPLPLW